jgi:hypothetical protein
VLLFWLQGCTLLQQGLPDTALEAAQASLQGNGGSKCSFVCALAVQGLTGKQAGRRCSFTAAKLQRGLQKMLPLCLPLKNTKPAAMLALWLLLKSTQAMTLHHRRLMAQALYLVKSTQLATRTTLTCPLQMSAGNHVELLRVTATQMP